VKPEHVLAAKELVQVHASNSAAILEMKKKGHRTGVTYAITGDIEQVRMVNNCQQLAKIPVRVASIAADEHL